MKAFAYDEHTKRIYAWYKHEYLGYVFHVVSFIFLLREKWETFLACVIIETQLSHLIWNILIVSVTGIATIISLWAGNIHWNLNFAISLIANSLNFNFAYYYIFKNLLVIAYTIEIQQSFSLILLILWIWLIWARSLN